MGVDFKTSLIQLWPSISPLLPPAAPLLQHRPPSLITASSVPALHLSFAASRDTLLQPRRHYHCCLTLLASSCWFLHWHGCSSTCLSSLLHHCCSVFYPQRLPLQTKHLLLQLLHQCSSLLCLSTYLSSQLYHCCSILHLSSLLYYCCSLLCLSTCLTSLLYHCCSVL